MVRENNQSGGRQEGLPEVILLTIPGSVVATKHLIARKEHINYIPTVDGIEEVTETDKKYSHIIPSSLVDIAITNGGKLTINPTQIVKL